MGSGGARYLVLSDMHFGTPRSSVNDARYRDALVSYMASRSPWDEIVLTGDLLDVNLSTLTRAIEGRRSGAVDLCGFRRFLQELEAKMKAEGQGKTLEDLAARWVYVPGNHDYKVWDMLATRVVCEDVLASGARIDGASMPLARYAWPGGTSFFAGIFQPFGVQARVQVEYPNHEVAFGPEAATMVFTHGHYLDPSQTRGHDLTDNLRGVTAPAHVRAVVRKIVIETAQYQTVANAVSFTEDTTRIVNDLVGPDGWLNKLRTVSANLATWLLRSLFWRDGSLRGDALSGRQLSNIDYYLERFCGYQPLPRWFVFGHTHRQGRGKTSRLGIEVYNAGSCYPDRGRPVTFLEVEADGAGVPRVRLMYVGADAVVSEAA